MTTLELARWQFGITTVYHFFFVPITIGLSVLVAVLETAWFRTRDERYLQLTKFFGKLFLINFAMGVVTGIVQEFQFGMNWSDYSRFVGDIFGAPLAIEGLLAFFLESTFLGLWIFGWDRLGRRAHLVCIWMVAGGTVLSAYFILAANSWMQNPVGAELNLERGRAELNDIGAVLTNKVVLASFPHTIMAALMTAGAFVAGIAAWQAYRGRDSDRSAFRTALRLGAVVTLVAGIGVAVSGDLQGKVMTEVQPMKMAAAEALYDTEQPASFSLLTIGSLDGSKEVFAIRVPKLLSFLATGSFEGKVEGVDDLETQFQTEFGPGSYRPNIPITYWSFRIMIGLGVLAMAVAGWLLWAGRGRRQPTSRWLLRAGLLLPLMPLFANSFGWIFTELGRQPWIVYGLMRTADGVSPGTTTGEVLTSLVIYTALYGGLAVIEVGLLFRVIRHGLPDVTPPDQPVHDDTLTFAY